MSFTTHHLYFDDVAIGQEWESPGRTLTEADIVNFAGLSGDFNPIHMDHEFAKSTPFRRPIAHGLLGIALGSGLGINSPPMRTLAFMTIKEWHFREPIFVGDTIRIRSKVLEKEARSRGRRGVITWQRQIVNQEGRVVQEGATVTMVEGRGDPPKASAASAQRPDTMQEERGVRHEPPHRS
jgi:acyl dehydratase